MEKHGIIASTEQRIRDLTQAIRKNGWLSELELEAIRQKVAGVENLVFEEQECVNVDTAISELHLDFAGCICIDENHFADIDPDID